jgi:EpsI family protein
MSSYVSRTYGRDSTAAFWVYVGYYESQTQGKTIHSPKNCLPGAGWEPLESAPVQLALSTGPVPVNRYLIANDNQRALVLYWYQGRGRISANEYLVKWELLRDATLRRRTDEALVRVIVPIRGTEEEAEALARRVAERLATEVSKLVPA